MVATDCWDLIKEFVKGFAGSITDNPTNHLSSKMDGVYGPADTVLQYLEHFNNFRKTATPRQR